MLLRDIENEKENDCINSIGFDVLDVTIVSFFYGFSSDKKDFFLACYLMLSIRGYSNSSTYLRLFKVGDENLVAFPKHSHVTRIGDEQVPSCI